MDREAVLADFNEQMRRNPAVDSGARVERADHVTRAVSTGTAIGWNGVLWTDLSDANADVAISAQLSRFAEIGEPWEWKHYSYDQPADLPQRLQQAGLVPAEPEALLIAEIADLDFLDTPPPAGVELVPVTDEAGAARVVRLHDAVFGGDHARTGAEVLAGLAVQPQSVAAVLAMAGDTAICAGRVKVSAMLFCVWWRMLPRSADPAAQTKAPAPIAPREIPHAGRKSARTGRGENAQGH